MKKIWILTLFPEYFTPLLDCGVVGQALRGERSEGKFEINLVDIRQYSPQKYKGVDDTPFGGGAGMVMRADILENALLKGVLEAGEYEDLKKLHVVCPAPRGEVWNHTLACQFAKNYLSFDTSQDIVFVCGRYEGIDERFLKTYVNQFISVGDYILSGGELAVCLILDSALRFVPGVLGNKVSNIQESFADGLLEHPQYTKPREACGLEVPEVLLNGHHQKIQDFQKEQRVQMTKKYRPDLWEKK